MTYVTEQTSGELRAHMRRLQAMPGWHNPLDDRLYREILDQDAEIEKLRAHKSATPPQPEMVTLEMIDRFLSWKLPDDFNPDCGISFSPLKYGNVPSWPTGTNLLTAVQAKAMLEHVLGKKD